MMKKIHYMLMLCLGFVCLLKAQQLPQYTNYVLNDFVLNPALAGTKEDFEVKSDNRYQWVGITDAPRTFVLSVDGPYQTMNMGFGGYVYSDVTGPTSRTGFALCYGYHVKLTDQLKLSLGLSGGIEQFALDGTQITLHDPGDPALPNAYQSVLVPDFGFGAQLYSDKYWLGISIPQLYEARLKFLNSTSSELDDLKTHFYITGGYNYDVNDNVRIEPSFLLQYVDPIPLQINLSVRAIYKKMVWIGGGIQSYFSGGLVVDAISMLVGYTYKDYLLVAYSYDFPTSTISSYTTGTHEIMFGLKFKNKPRKN
jgi:type IX secretion system PorP/SprF family membrane protein